MYKANENELLCPSYLLLCYWIKLRTNLNAVLYASYLTHHWLRAN